MSKSFVCAVLQSGVFKFKGDVIIPLKRYILLLYSAIR